MAGGRHTRNTFDAFELLEKRVREDGKLCAGETMAILHITGSRLALHKLSFVRVLLFENRTS